MIRKILIIFLMFIILLFNSACASNKKDDVNGSIKASFAIYLVKDEKTFEAINKDINKLALEGEPIITDQNILSYIWNEHKFTLIKDEKLQKILEEKVYMKVPTDGKPFVVVCNGERIYLGSFWTLLSSLSAPKCPTIVSDFSDKDSFQIGYTYDKGDSRNDKRIYKAFEKLEKLK